MDWRPDIGGGDAPAYQRIVEALAADIERGALTPGARLPTQRALAHRLGLGIGTVTRAYAEAGQRGLIDGVVGRGSFVADDERARRATGPSTSPATCRRWRPAAAALRAAIAGLARRGDLVRAARLRARRRLCRRPPRRRRLAARARQLPGAPTRRG